MKKATEDDLREIRREAINDRTRTIMGSGIFLSFDEAAELGDNRIDWLRNRLGLSVRSTDQGVECRPGTEDAE